MFMNNMEDRRKNLASKLWILQTRENPGSLPSTFDACEYQLRASIHSCQLVENLEIFAKRYPPHPPAIHFNFQGFLPQQSPKWCISNQWGWGVGGAWFPNSAVIEEMLEVRRNVALKISGILPADFE